MLKIQLNFSNDLFHAGALKGKNKLLIKYRGEINKS